MGFGSGPHLDMLKYLIRVCCLDYFLWADDKHGEAVEPCSLVSSGPKWCRIPPEMSTKGGKTAVKWESQSHSWSHNRATVIYLKLNSSSWYKCPLHLSQIIKPAASMFITFQSSLAFVFLSICPVNLVLSALLRCPLIPAILISHGRRRGDPISHGLFLAP